MATQGSNSKAYFSNLLKLWDLDGVESRILLETGQPPRDSGVSAGEHSAHNVPSSNAELPTHNSTKHHSTLVDSAHGGGHYVVGSSDTSVTQTLRHCEGRFCPGCGYSNEHNANWCVECGTALIGARQSGIHDTKCSNHIAAMSEDSNWNKGESARHAGYICKAHVFSETRSESRADLTADLEEMSLNDPGNLRIGPFLPLASNHLTLQQHSDQTQSLMLLTRQSTNNSMTVCFQPSSVYGNHAPSVKNPEATCAEDFNLRASANTDRKLPSHHAPLCSTSELKGSSQVSSHADSSLNTSACSIPPAFKARATEAPSMSTPLYERHWKTSGTYMWRKLSTLQSESQEFSQNGANISNSPMKADHSSIANVPTNEDSSNLSSVRLHPAVPKLDLQVVLAYNRDSDVHVVAHAPQDHKAEQSSRSEHVPALTALPDEVLLAILSCLSHSELIKCMLVCRRLCRIASDPVLWRSVTLHKARRVTDQILLNIATRRPHCVTFSHCQANTTARGMQVFFQKLSTCLCSLTIDTCDFGPHTGDVLLTTASLHCPALAAVDIRWTQLSARALVYAAEHCDNLEEVFLEQTPDITADSLYCLIKNHKHSLRVLKHKGPGKRNFATVVHIMEEIIGKLCRKHICLPNLKTLATSSSQLEDGFVTKLRATFPNLKKLELHCSEVSEAATLQLSHIPLESLSLYIWLPLSDVSLAHIAGMSTLRHLALQSMNEESVCILCSSSLRLESLSLANSSLTESSLQQIATAFSQTLRRLEIKNCSGLQESTERATQLLLQKCRKKFLLDVS